MAIGNWQPIPLASFGVSALNSVYYHISDWWNNNPTSTMLFPSLGRNTTSKFAHTTRNLNVEQALQGKHISEGEIQGLISALQEGNWKADAFKDDKRFPYIALQAFQKAKIGKEEFTNVMFYWSICQHHSIDETQVLQLYDSHQNLNQEVAGAVLKTTISQDSFFDSKQQELFLERFKTLPRSAQTFFVFPDIQPTPQNESPPTWSQKIQRGHDISFFNRIEINGKRLRMVPSFEMMQELLYILSPQHAVTMMPTLGASTIEDIRQNSLLGQKDISIPFPNLSLSKAVDNLKCKELYDLFYYGFYQAIQTSFVPHEERVLFIKISDIAAQLGQNATPFPLLRVYAEELRERGPSATPFPLLRIYAKELSERLINLEHTYYNPVSMQGFFKRLSSQDPIYKGKKIEDHRLLISLHEVIRSIPFLENDHAEAQGRTTLQDLTDSQFPQKFVQKIIQLFSSNRDQLQSFCKKLIDCGMFLENHVETTPFFLTSDKGDMQVRWASHGKELCQFLEPLISV